jgi:hypothetical protein
MEGLTPSQKGAIAEIAFALEALKLGLRVYRPVAEGGRCDLILGSKVDSCGSNANSAFA